MAVTALRRIMNPSLLTVDMFALIFVSCFMFESFIKIITA